MIRQFLCIFFCVFLISCSYTINDTPDYDLRMQEMSKWFINNKDSNFIYYDNDPYRIFLQNYHPLRELLALWSIYEYLNYVEDSKLRNLANDGLEYFLKNSKYDPSEDFFYINVNSERISLGQSAFMLMALIQSNHPKKEYYIEKFSNGILSLQNEDGSFNTFFYSERKDEQEYYPGQAMLSLISLYEYTGDTRYLDSVNRAYKYYSNYWRQSKSIAMISWHSQALYIFYQKNKQTEIAQFIFEMNDYISAAYTQDNCTTFKFSNLQAPVLLEGMNKAYVVAKQLNDTERTFCYGNFIRDASNFTLNLQVMEANMFNKKDLGGIRISKHSDYITCDNVGHALNAIVGAKETGII